MSELKFDGTVIPVTHLLPNDVAMSNETPLAMWARCAPEEAVNGRPMAPESARKLIALHALLNAPHETIELPLRKWRVPFDEVGES